MALPTRAPTFGFRAASFVPYTNPDTGAEGTEVLFPANVEFAATEAFDEATQPYNDTAGDVAKYNRRIEITYTDAGFAPEVEAAISGAELTTTGTTPNQVKQVKHNVYDVPPKGNFYARQIVNGTLSDVRTVIYGVTFLGAASANGAQGAFTTNERTARGVGHPTTGDLMDRDYRETASSTLKPSA